MELKIRFGVQLKEYSISAENPEKLIEKILEIIFRSNWFLREKLIQRFYYNLILISIDDKEDPMKGLAEEEMVKRITDSIEKEIERIDQRAEKCRLKN